MYVCLGEEETSADNSAPGKSSWTLNTEGILTGKSWLEKWLINNEENNSNDPTLIHNVIKLVFCYCFDWETPSGRKYQLCI